MNQRPTFGFFPTPDGGDPNRIDGGPVASSGVTVRKVVRVPIPPACKWLLRVVLVAVRTTPAAPVQGGTADLFVSGSRPATGNPAVTATTVVASQLDAGYTIAATAGADFVDITFAGIVAETYLVGASVHAYGVRQP
jgi:hypothetical protein